MRALVQPRAVPHGPPRGARGTDPRDGRAEHQVGTEGADPRPGLVHPHRSYARCPPVDRGVKRMRAAAVQLSSTPDRDRNLEAADRLTRAAAAQGAELVVLPEKWPVLGTAEQTAAGAEPLDGPALDVGARRGARARDRPRRGLDRRARRGRRARRQHGRARRARRRGPRGLPQDPHVRRRGRRAHLPRVGARGARRRGRALGDGGRRRPRADHLLRPALPRALPHPRGARRADPHRVRGVHRDHHARALGGAAAGAGDRGPVLRRRRQPDRRARARPALRRAVDDRRPVGRRAGHGARRRDRRGRGPRPRAASAPSARKLPSLANRQAAAYRWPEPVRA